MKALRRSGDRQGVYVDPLRCMLGSDYFLTYIYIYSVQTGSGALPTLNALSALSALSASHSGLQKVGAATVERLGQTM